MPLDFFKTGADTGYNNLNSVQPVSNAETADQTVFRRPSENIRNRSEVIRRAVDEALAEMSSDRGLVLVSDSADATITWGGPKPGGTGKFTVAVGTDLRVIPVLNPSAGSAKNDVWGRRLYTWSGTKYFTMRSKLRISEGGNNIKTEIFSVNGETFGGGQAVNVTIEGSQNPSSNYDPLYGPVKVRIQLSKTGGAIQSRWSDVLTGITGNAYSNAWLSAGVTVGEESTLAVECTSGYFWESGGAGWTSVSGCDAQGYRVTASELSTFFGTATNELYEGDTLFLKYATAKDRLDQAGDVTIGATLLKILHRNEGTEPVSPVSQSDAPNLMHCIPLCHVDNGNLIFISGTVIPTGGTGTVAPDTTLRAELADDGDGTGSVDCGSKLVAGDVQPGTKTPKNYAQGTLFAQLGQMLDWTNDHYKGLDATTKHNYEDLLNRPAYYVSPVSGEGDFTTLGAALNDATIRASGGVIFIKSGASLSENIVLGANIAGPVTIIGNDVVISPSGSSILFSSGSFSVQSIEFIGISFSQSGDYRIFDIGDAAPLFYVGYSFRNCLFSKTSGAAEMIRTAGNVETYNCVFDTSSGYANGTVAFKYYPTDGATEHTLRIKGCHFKQCAIVVERDTAGTYIWGQLLIEDCYLEECGYSSSGASIGTLIKDTDSDGVRNISICRNRVEGSLGVTNSALFCSVIGNGIIGSNAIMQGLAQTPSSEKYMIVGSSSTTSGEEGVLLIQNNTLETEEAGAINASYRTRVIGNHIQAFAPSANCPYALYASASGAYFGNNEVTITSSSVACRGIYLGASDACAVGNRIAISGGTAVHHAINAPSTGAMISCNILSTSSSTAHRGVSVSGFYSTVVGNSITDFFAPIYCSGASSVTIMGNMVNVPEPTAACTAIYAAASSTVTGNTILFATNSTAYGVGVYLGGNNCVVNSNVIKNTVTGIDLASSLYSVVSGNHVTLNSYTSGACGVSATSAMRFSISGNNIYMPDVTNAVAINCARGSATEIMGAITGNTVIVGGTTNTTGRRGIDCTYCDALAVSGNSLWPYLSMSSDQYILVTSATGVGLGKSITTPNTETYNRWDQPA